MRTCSLKLACLVAVVALSCGQQPAPTATLTVILEGSGVVRSTPGGIDCGSVCTATFPQDTSVTLTAEPMAGFVFAGWSGACSGTGGCSLVLSEDRAASARFTAETRTLTVVLIGDGAGSVSSSAGLSCPGTCTVSQPKGTTVTLSAVAAATSAFVGWTGGGCSGTGECAVKLDTDLTVQVAFALKQSLVVSRAGTGTGTITSSPPGIDCGADCAESFAPGTEVTLSATPASGSTFAGWSGACSGLETCHVVVSAPSMVTATFTRQQHPLTVTKTGSGTGTIASTPAGITCGADCDEVFDEGTVVTLNAIAASGSVFSEWTGACTGGGACVVTMNTATSVSANFTLERHLVSVTKTGTGAGQVVSSPVGITCGSDCEEGFDFGSTVTLTATASAGASFDGWSGGSCSGLGACTFTVTGPTTVTATFTTSAHPLTVLRAGTGTGTVTSSPAGISCGTDCSETFVYGTRVILTATPAVGSTFVGWSGGGCLGAGSCSVDVTEPLTISAVFDVNQYPLVVSKTGAGSGTVSSSPVGISCGTDCAESYPHGTVVSLTATADASSTFAGWSGACSGTSTCTVTLEGAATVSARFDLKQYTVTVTRAGSGSGSVESVPSGISCGADCTQAWAHGTLVALTAIPATGSTFAGWSGAGCSGTAACNLTVGAAVTVTATFTLNHYTLTIARAGTGTGTVTSSPAGISCGADCSESYGYGTTVVLTATPAARSAFAGWSGGCLGTGTCSVTITAARTLTATFVPRGTYFTIADATDTVQRVDPDTMVVTDVGALGVNYAFGDLAWNPANSTLYMVDGRGAKSLYTVSTTTGAATSVGVHGLTDLFALAYGPSTGLLYGITSNGNLYRLSVTSGAATLLGSTGVNGINGLAWDSTRSRMVAITAALSGAATYSINLTTGAATVLASGLAGLDNNGWTYDPIADRFIAVDYPGEVYAFDPSTFARVQLVSGAVNRTGIAFVP